MMLEAVTVPFYHGLIGSELNKYLELVEIKMACVNTLEQYHLLKNLPEDKQITGPIVVFNENTQILDTDFHYSDFLKMGRERLDGEIIEYEEIFMGGDENHIITLMFSSGTSARRPSPVKLTHKNILTNIVEIKALVGADITDKDRAVSFLPMSHILARTGDLYSSLVMKHEIYFIPSMDDLIDFLPKVSPHYWYLFQEC